VYFVLRSILSSAESPWPGRIAVLNLHGKADDFVFAGLHFRQVEAFDDPNAGAKDDLVAFDAVALVAADGKVINADGANAAVHQMPRGFPGNVDELRIELFVPPLPPELRVLRRMRSPFLNLCFLSSTGLTQSASLISMTRQGPITASNGTYRVERRL